ncbi:unnamed protein product [Schistosoma intercalatum]|nr:unnamed protein product [Schistosoma intercalatum]
MYVQVYSKFYGHHDTTTTLRPLSLLPQKQITYCLFLSSGVTKMITSLNLKLKNQRCANLQKTIFLLNLSKNHKSNETSI